MQKIIGKGSLFFLEHIFFVSLLSFDLVYSVLTKAEEVAHASQDIFKKIVFFYTAMPLYYMFSIPLFPLPPAFFLIIDDGPKQSGPLISTHFSAATLH